MKLAVSVVTILFAVLSVSQAALQRLLERSPDFNNDDLLEVMAEPESALDILGGVLCLPGNIKGLVHTILGSGLRVQLHHLEIASQNGHSARLLKSHLCTSSREHTIDLSKEYKRLFDLARLEQITCNSPSLTLGQVFDVMTLWESDKAQFQAGKEFLELHGLKLNYSNLFTPARFGRTTAIKSYFDEIDLTHLFDAERDAADDLLQAYSNLIINEQVPVDDKTAIGELIFDQLTIQANIESLTYFFTTIRGQERNPEVQRATMKIMQNGIVFGQGYGSNPRDDPKQKIEPIPETF